MNGKAGAVLALAWVMLRVMYASMYRNSVGIPSNKKGLGTYTIPCYFLFTQDEDLANGVYYSATIMDRDDIENESDSKNIMNSRGKIYGVYEYYMKRNAAATEAEEESDT